MCVVATTKVARRKGPSISCADQRPSRGASHHSAPKVHTRVVDAKVDALKTVAAQVGTLGPHTASVGSVL